MHDEGNPKDEALLTSAKESKSCVRPTSPEIQKIAIDSRLASMGLSDNGKAISPEKWERVSRDNSFSSPGKHAPLTPPLSKNNSLSAKSVSPRQIREPTGGVIFGKVNLDEHLEKMGIQDNGVPISPVKAKGDKDTKAKITAVSQLYDDIEYDLSESEEEEEGGGGEEGDTSGSRLDLSLLQKLSDLSSPEKAKELPRLLVHDKDQDDPQPSPLSFASEVEDGGEISNAVPIRGSKSPQPPSVFSSAASSPELSLRNVLPADSSGGPIVDFSEYGAVGAESSVRKLSDLKPNKNSRGGIGGRLEGEKGAKAGEEPAQILDAKQGRKDKARLTLPLDLQMRIAKIKALSSSKTSPKKRESGSLYAVPAVVDPPAKSTPPPAQLGGDPEDLSENEVDILRNNKLLAMGWDDDDLSSVSPMKSKKERKGSLPVAALPNLLPEEAKKVNIEKMDRPQRGGKWRPSPPKRMVDKGKRNAVEDDEANDEASLVDSIINSKSGKRGSKKESEKIKIMVKKERRPSPPKKKVEKRRQPSPRKQSPEAKDFTKEEAKYAKVAAKEEAKAAKITAKEEAKAAKAAAKVAAKEEAKSAKVAEVADKGEASAALPPPQEPPTFLDVNPVFPGRNHTTALNLIVAALRLMSFSFSWIAMFGPYIAVSSLTSIGNNSAVINKNINMWSGFWAAADSWPHNVAVIRAFLILLVIFTFFAFVCSSLTLKGSENDKLGKAGIMCDIIAWLSALIVFSCYTSQILMEFYGYGFAFDVICFCVSFLAMCGAIFDTMFGGDKEPQAPAEAAAPAGEGGENTV
ncbi:hypothetical protein TrRE_jg3531 [Triparma retinervis]|uniref:Uncharacterized protein n=1 Tax=Triparma retinervis TaxID=2557542 RepID=A0A9W7ACU2_9STRA|nr:hypothetical protein TrRE_jg3531 [Triparma retinervis]